jgi:hypothetical protein
MGWAACVRWSDAAWLLYVSALPLLLLLYVATGCV